MCGAGGAGGCSRLFCSALGGGAGEHAPESGVAGTALVTDAATLKVANGGGAVVDGPGDLSVGFAAADADDHVYRSFVLLLVLRLSLSTSYIMLPPGGFVNRAFQRLHTQFGHGGQKRLQMESRLQ